LGPQIKDTSKAMDKLEILKQIALEAGKLVKDGYKRPKNITHKGVVDLVTEYDQRVEKLILSRLQEYFPGYSLVGEESYDGDLQGSKIIYIDPIDGTTNFIHGIPHLGISIGIWEDNAPIAAVVYNPILHEMFSAAANHGAFCNDIPLRVSEQDELQQSLIGTGFPYAKVNMSTEYHWVIDTLTSILPHIRDIRRLGAAAIDLCYLAQGRIDGFYEIDLQPWDVAAGILIVQEAGGEISNLSGEPYNISDKGIVASNSKIHTQILSHTKAI